MPARSYSYPNSTEIVLRRGSSGSIAGGGSNYTTVSHRSSTADHREPSVSNYSRTTISIRTNDSRNLFASRRAAPSTISSSSASSSQIYAHNSSHSSSRWDAPDHADPHIEGLPTHEYFSSGLSRNLRLPEWRGQRRNAIDGELDSFAGEDLGFGGLQIDNDRRRHTFDRQSSSPSVIHASAPTLYRSSTDHSIASSRSQARSRSRSRSRVEPPKRPSIYRSATEHAKSYYYNAENNNNHSAASSKPSPFPHSAGGGGKVIISTHSEDSHGSHNKFHYDYDHNDSHSGSGSGSKGSVLDDDSSTVVPDDSISCISPRARLDKSKAAARGGVTRKSARGLEQGGGVGGLLPYELVSTTRRMKTY